MEKEKKTNKAKEQQAVVPYFPSEIKLSMDWGGLVNEVRSLIREINQETTPYPAPATHLDELLVKELVNIEKTENVRNVYDDDANPYSDFVKVFKGYGFPSNVVVDKIQFGYNHEFIEADIDCQNVQMYMDKDDIKRLIDVMDDKKKKNELALELFPKYFGDVLKKHSFFNYSRNEEDYTKYSVPEGVEIKDAYVTVNELSAKVNDKHMTAELLPADYVATLCFDINGFRIPKVTPEQLAVKYFLKEGKEEKCDVSITAEIYAEYLKETLYDMQKTAYKDTTSEWLAISDLGKSLSISDNKISGKVYSNDRLVVIEPILLAVKYMFCKEHKINLSDVPQVEVLIIGTESEEHVVVEEVVEELLTVHRGGGRRGR